MIFIFIACVLTLCVDASAASIRSGEKIHYNVSQMGLKVGEATLTFVGPKDYQGQPAILISFHAKGFNFLDDEQIYVDPGTYKPVAVLRDLNIFGNKEKIEERYVQGRVNIIKNAGGKQSEVTIDKAGWMDNIYAVIFQYRQAGESKMTDRLDVRLPTKDITIKMAKRVPLNAAGKKYNAFYMESVPAKYKLWFDASENKLPLRISGAIGVANTSMVMTKYEE